MLKIGYFRHIFRYYSTGAPRITMPNLRYFINPYLDTTFSGAEPHIPRDDLYQAVQEIFTKIADKLQPIEKNATDGIYLGTAGISYMYYHVTKNLIFEDQKHKLLNEAIRYLKPALNVATYNTRHPSDLPSFILGNCGIYAVAAAVHNALGDKSQSKLYVQLYQEAGRICKEPKFLNCGSDELFVGRAGYILGALWLAKETKTDLKLGDISEICSVMVSSGREYAKHLKSPCPLMYSYYQIEYLGAAHGLSSILQSLMSVPGYLDAHPDVKTDVQACVDYILHLQNIEGNFPAATDEIGLGAELVHWCHGAGGIVYMMARAYLVFKSSKYLESCKKMAELIWNKGLLKKGPGLCHGVAGNGYVFLLMYRLTMNPMYLYRAICFFQFMETDEFKLQSRVPDYPFSLYEGIAGTACFLADLTAPITAAFPFSDVFE